MFGPDDLRQSLRLGTKNAKNFMVFPARFPVVTAGESTHFRSSNGLLSHLLFRILLDWDAKREVTSNGTGEGVQWRHFATILSLQACFGSINRI